MEKAIIGKKLGMTQVFTDDGRVQPVTVIEAGPCYVTQIKSVEKDGYNSVQVAFGEHLCHAHFSTYNRFFHSDLLIILP